MTFLPVVARIPGNVAKPSSAFLYGSSRETFNDAAHKDLADKLAAEAIEAARRQVDNKYFVTMMLEWGQVAIDAGDKKTAEKRWTELLTEVTKRPERRAQPDQGPQPGRIIRPAPAAPAPAAAPSASTSPTRHTAKIALSAPRLSPLAWLALLAVDTAPVAAPAPPRPVQPNAAANPNAPPATNGVPPLTISQFRLATQIAIAAADNDMPQLSQTAVEKAMAGGIPVPDPPKTTTPQQGIIVRTQQVGGPPEAVGADRSGSRDDSSQHTR